MDARVQQPGREADHVPLSGAEVKNAHSGTSATHWLYSLVLTCTRKAVTQQSRRVSRTSGLITTLILVTLLVKGQRLLCISWSQYHRERTLFLVGRARMKIVVIVIRDAFLSSRCKLSEFVTKLATSCTL